MMDEDIVNDSDERFTEELLRETLGPEFRPAILRQVREAEGLLIDRKDHLTDLVDAGVITEERFADLANRFLSVYLRTVARVVGEDVCRKMYNYGPDDEVELVNPQEMPVRKEYRAMPEILTRIVENELRSAGDGVSVDLDATDFDENSGLRSIIQLVAAKGEQMISGDTSRKEVSCWQAAMLAVYLVNSVPGDAVGQPIWRICEDIILVVGDCYLEASDDAVDEFYRRCRGTQTEPNGDVDGFVEPEEIKQIEQWLSERRQSLSPSPLAEPDD